MQSTRFLSTYISELKHFENAVFVGFTKLPISFLLYHFQSYCSHYYWKFDLYGGWDKDCGKPESFTYCKERAAGIRTKLEVLKIFIALFLREVL